MEKTCGFMLSRVGQKVCSSVRNIQSVSLPSKTMKNTPGERRRQGASTSRLDNKRKSMTTQTVGTLSGNLEQCDASSHIYY